MPRRGFQRSLTVDKLLLFLLGAFLLLFGLAAITNLQIVWMGPATGLAALAAGVVCVVRACR